MEILKIPYSGKSMYPSLLDGDVLLVDCLQKNTCSLGDIILSKSQQEFFSHRVIGKTHDLKMMTKGDFSLVYDDDTKCLGKVVGIERKGSVLWWGNRGQFFKRQIALLSRFRDFKFPWGVRVFARIFISILALF